MAKENIAKFFYAAMTDSALAAKLAALAAENGYDFTAEELLELGAARPLSDEDAESAAGSGPTFLIPPPPKCSSIEEFNEILEWYYK